MKREMARPSNRNLATVKELMALTHAYRRELFLKETIPINQFIDEYPALKTSAGVKAEFGCVLGIDKPVKMMATNFQKWVGKVLVFASSQPVAREIMLSLEEAIEDSPLKKKNSD